LIPRAVATSFWEWMIEYSTLAVISVPIKFGLRLEFSLGIPAIFTPSHANKGTVVLVVTFKIHTHRDTDSHIRDGAC